MSFIDPLDARWFVVDDATWDALQDRAQRPAAEKPRLAALLNESSFGTEEARAARASISDERVANVLRRMRELDAEKGL